MREAVVLGSVTSTIKHPGLKSKKLLVVQLLNAKREPDGLPQIIPDCVGAGKGDRVLLNMDGIYMSETYGSPIPVRAFLCGIIDEFE